jgi:alcohol dehydrogenase
MTGKPALCEPGAAANGKGTLLDGGIRLKNKDLHFLNHHLGVSAFAEYAVVSKHSLIKIMQPIPYQIAALFGCAVLTGMGAVVNTASLAPGQSVLVVGLGGVGLAAVLGALASGAGKVIAADINPDKRKKALELGASEVIDSSNPDAVTKLKEEYTKGGVDIAVEFAGAIPALEFAYNCTKRGGTTVTAGLPHPSKRLEISPVVMVGEERTLKGSYLGSCIPFRDIPAYMSLYESGKLAVDKLLSGTLQLEEINKGFEKLANGEAIRQVITFA